MMHLFTRYAHLISLALLIVVVGVSSSYGQGYFEAVPVDDSEKPPIESILEYRLFELDAKTIFEFAQGVENRFNMVLDFGTVKLDANLELRPKVAQPTSYIATAQGIETYQRAQNIFAKGVQKTNASEGVYYVLGDDFFAGAFVLDRKEYIIEPLWFHIPEAERNLFIVYQTDHSIFLEDYQCGTTEAHNHADPDYDHDTDEEVGDARFSGCQEVEYGSALDWLFVNEYGGVNGAWNRVDFVMGLVETQYTGYFNWDFIFVRTAEFASTCSSCNPSEWTTGNDAEQLLITFRSWAEGGGFGNDVYDVAGIWTDRDFAGGTVGIAYVGATCGSFRYHALQDYSSVSWQMRVMVSHELGHNLDADHDGGSGFIMSPSVNNTTNWSNTSLTAINNWVNGNGGNCFDDCFIQQPPVADFSASENDGCAPLTIQFTDASTNNPTSWSWTFEGGSPGSSSMENPSVTYNQQGLWDVTLTVTNPGGSDTKTEIDFIEVFDIPDTYFEYIADEDVVSFINLSSGGTSWFWDFGDGNTSTEESPTHTYADDGIYEVTLTGTNTCGSTSHVEFVEVVTTPIADFEADITEDCAPLTVTFEDLSTPNTTGWSWTFPGGVPATSTLQNPVVEYNQAGVYSVTLTASNAAGQTTLTRTNYITVTDVPTGGFNFTVQIDSVFFSSFGMNDSISWDFGDGGSSFEKNPVHVYATEGTFTVLMTLYNECGETSYMQDVTVVFLPEADFTATPTSGCTPLEVAFQENASANTTSFQWVFPGGSPASSTEADPFVIYDAPGQYNVTFVAINSVGTDTLILVNYITVLADPVAGFTAVVENGNEATFTNTSQDATSYVWDFGDGSGSTEENPTHTYAIDGEYTVTLWAYNQCDSSFFTQDVEVILPPVSNFSASPTSGCLPLVVTFEENASANTTSFQWIFPGGTPATSTDPDPVVTYDTAGQYTVTLIAQNSIGSDTLTLVNYITALADPLASFTVDVQNGNEATFTNTSQFGDTFAWNFGDGEGSTEQNPVHTYMTEGEFTVTLWVYNQCDSSFFSLNVNAILPPQANFSADTTVGCSPMEVQFMDQSSESATSWSWTFEGGEPATSSDQNPLVVYNLPGTYTVTLEVSNPIGNNTTVKVDYILVNTIPTPSFTSNLNDGTVQFTNQSQNGTAYSWDFGDGGSSTEENPIHNYGVEGDFAVSFTVSNSCGDTTITDTVSVYFAPEASFTAENNQGCGDSLVVEFGNLTAGFATAYQWIFPGGNPAQSIESDPVITYTTPGNYDVTLIASGPGGNDTLTILDYVQFNGDYPLAGFSYEITGKDIAFTDKSENGLSYFWDFGDGNTSNESAPAHTYAANGNYVTTQIISNLCGSDTLTEEVMIISSNTYVLGDFQKLEIFPNPNSGSFRILLNGEPSAQIFIEMMDVLGRKVYGELFNFEQGSLDTRINLENPVPGMYFLLINQGEKMLTKRIHVTSN